MKQLFLRLRYGILTKNPVFIQMLGLCPALAATNTVKNAIGMGLAVLFVLTCSNLLVSLLRSLISPQIRLIAYMIIIAGFVSIVDLLIQAYFHNLSASLGVFIPLIISNCMILGRADEYASKVNPVKALFDGLGMGLGFLIALISIASIREILGNGSFFGIHIPIFNGDFKPASIFLHAPGGFLVLAFVIAAVQKWSKKEAKR